MAPRTRGRPPKRTARMDAAIDAMAPFGFNEDVVLAKMRQLLKEYGGQDGYGFIELDAYCVLLEALLADQDKSNQEQFRHGETSKANEIIEAEKASFVDIPICNSTFLTIPSPPPPPEPLVAPLPPLEPPVAQLPPPEPLVAPLPPPPPLVSLPPPPRPIVEEVPPLPPVPPENGQPQWRKPCHGWISDFEEKWNFIKLPSSFNLSISPPATPPTEPMELDLTGGRKNQLKRRSRWDEMPEDV